MEDSIHEMLEAKKNLFAASKEFYKDEFRSGDFIQIILNGLGTRRTQIRCSLVGQDIRLSPERPGFKSRQRNVFSLFPNIFAYLNQAH